MNQLLQVLNLIILIYAQLVLKPFQQESHMGIKLSNFGHSSLLFMMEMVTGPSHCHYCSDNFQWFQIKVENIN